MMASEASDKKIGNDGIFVAVTHVQKINFHS